MVVNRVHLAKITLSAVAIFVALFNSPAGAEDAVGLRGELGTLIGLSRGYIGQFAINGKWLDIPKVGGPVQEYNLVGTGWRITKCNGSWIVQTNFQLANKNEVVGNFLIYTNGEKLAVQELSFGVDDSLQSFRSTAVQSYNVGDMMLRLDYLR